jgi:hypothetical protein
VSVLPSFSVLSSQDIASKFPEKQQVLAMKALKGTLTADDGAKDVAADSEADQGGSPAAAAAVNEEEDTFFDRPTDGKRPSKNK